MTLEEIYTLVNDLMIDYRLSITDHQSGLTGGLFQRHDYNAVYDFDRSDFQNN